MDRIVAIVAGNVVGFDLKLAGAYKPAPVTAMVLRVTRGAIVVAEPESVNGLARIICHIGESGTNGTYWHEYKDLDGQGHSCDAINLMVDGQQIITDSFIQ